MTWESRFAIYCFTQSGRGEEGGQEEVQHSEVGVGDITLLFRDQILNNVFDKYFQNVLKVAWME